MGWAPPIIKQWKIVLKLDIRMWNMDTERLNSKISGWASRRSGNSCKNWNFRSQHLLKYVLHENNADNNTLQQLEKRMFDSFKRDWKLKIVAEQGTPPNQRNKLRTYRQFKHEYCTDPCVTKVYTD